MVFENGVKNIQATAYNGARTVSEFAQNSIEDTDQTFCPKYIYETTKQNKNIYHCTVKLTKLIPHTT